jgi:hypothetical protein
MRATSTLLLLALALGACSSSSSSSGEPTTQPASVTQPIGPEGGKIEVGGAVVTFPKGAVAASTMITISADSEAVPDGFIALSKRFKCGPTGTDFAMPVEMRMPFVDDGKGGSLFWSSPQEPAFKDLGGRVEGTMMVATILHFSEGFVGRKK